MGMTFTDFQREQHARAQRAVQINLVRSAAFMLTLTNVLPVPPEGISPARWRAMVSNYINRNGSKG